MKPLNDSCYLAPEKNFRVIQDDDPIKGANWRNAVQRHESDVDRNKAFNQTVMNYHFGKVNGDMNQINYEKEQLRQQR